MPDKVSNTFFPYGGGPTLKGVANLIAQPTTRNIVVMAGAGISTSASPPIPDFRSPGTGLYSNLEQYKLPYAEAIFDIDYFQRHPQPFFTLAKELYPGNFKPSLTHYFFTLLHEKGKLLRVFTQNVDTLETIAGLDAEKVVEAHGSFATATCTRCRKRANADWMRAKVMQGEIARCIHPHCAAPQQNKRFRIGKQGADDAGGKAKGNETGGGLVKPDIVFFGEGLPSRFFECVKTDLRKADLLIVVGTSLQVHPFAGLIDAVPDSCPRVLLNLERVAELAAYSSGGGMRASMNETGFDFEGNTHGGQQKTRDVFWQGKADDAVRELATLLHWDEELTALKEQGYAQLSPTETQADPEKKADAQAVQVLDKIKDPHPPADNSTSSSPATTTYKDATDQLADALANTQLNPDPAKITNT